MKCEYKKTTITIGPKGVIKSKTWQCSRQGKHPFLDDEERVILCTQHLKIAKKG